MNAKTPLGTERPFPPAIGSDKAAPNDEGETKEKIQEANLPGHDTRLEQAEARTEQAEARTEQAESRSELRELCRSRPATGLVLAAAQPAAQSLTAWPPH